METLVDIWTGGIHFSGIPPVKVFKRQQLYEAEVPPARAASDRFSPPKPAAWRLPLESAKFTRASGKPA